MCTRPSQHASITHERILDAAVEVQAERDYSAAGVREIGARSGTSKRSSYFQFSSKEKMVTALLEQISGKLVKKIQNSIRHQPTPLHRVAAGIDALIATFSRQRKIARILLLNIMGRRRATDRKCLPVWDRFSCLIQGALDAVIVRGQIGPQDTALMAQIRLGALHEVIVRWLLTGKPNPLTGVTPSLRTALLRSVGADPDSIQH